MMRNILLTIEYDGTDFSGWQIQPGVRTVQGELQKVVDKVCVSPRRNALCGEPDGENGLQCGKGEKLMKIEGTSRTDAGVHALGQRASFKGDFGIPTDRLVPVLNNLLPSDICIREAIEAPVDFHARFDAKGKKYIYKVMDCAEKNVFKRNFYYFIDKELDVSKMQEAASYLVGTHDFASFMAMGSTPQKTTVRTIYSYSVREVSRSEGGRELWLEVKGDGFLYNMVRIMTGTLVEVGLGRIAPSEMPMIIESCKRSSAGRTAPPQGLYLAEIYYDKGELDGD